MERTRDDQEREDLRQRLESFLRSHRTEHGSFQEILDRYHPARDVKSVPDADPEDVAFVDALFAWFDEVRELLETNTHYILIWYAKEHGRRKDGARGIRALIQQRTPSEFVDRVDRGIRVNYEPALRKGVELYRPKFKAWLVARYGDRFKSRMYCLPPPTAFDRYQDAVREHQRAISVVTQSALVVVALLPRPVRSSEDPEPQPPPRDDNAVVRSVGTEESASYFGVVERNTAPSEPQETPGAPDIAVTRNAFDFGAVPLHTPVSRSITITNLSANGATASLTYHVIGDLSATRANRSQNGYGYPITRTCQPACTGILPVDSAVVLTLAIPALPEGYKIDGQLVIASNDPDEGRIDIGVNAALPNDNLVFPQYLPMSTQHLASRTRELTVVNNGPKDFRVRAMRIAADPAFVFGYSSEPCMRSRTCERVIVVARGGQAQIPVTCQPKEAGAKRGTLTLESDDPSSPLTEVGLYCGADPLPHESKPTKDAPAPSVRTGSSMARVTEGLDVTMTKAELIRALDFGMVCGFDGEGGLCPIAFRDYVDDPWSTNPSHLELFETSRYAHYVTSFATVCANRHEYQSTLELHLALQQDADPDGSPIPLRVVGVRSFVDNDDPQAAPFAECIYTTFMGRPMWPVRRLGYWTATWDFLFDNAR